MEHSQGKNGCYEDALRKFENETSTLMWLLQFHICLSASALTFLLHSVCPRLSTVNIMSMNLFLFVILINPPESLGKAPVDAQWSLVRASVDTQ